MEQYINNETIVKDQIYEIFQNEVTCPLCNNIFIDTVICSNCQKAYCQKCIEKWSKNNDKCPKNCEKAKYQENKGKNDILTKLTFKCKKCGEEIKYDEVKNHNNSCSPSKKSSNVNYSTPSGATIKKISSEEMNKLIKKDKNITITYITDKNKS